ncbi:MAG: hypothetical protein, partial [Olavius algarvensis Gamma 1 endosymbiont]
LRPLRHFGQPLAPTPTADYPPRASRFPGGQRKKTLYNRYYETFAEFKAACEEFFRNPSKYQRE